MPDPREIRAQLMAIRVALSTTGDQLHAHVTHLAQRLEQYQADQQTVAIISYGRNTGRSFVLDKVHLLQNFRQILHERNGWLSSFGLDLLTLPQVYDLIHSFLQRGPEGLDSAAETAARASTIAEHQLWGFDEAISITERLLRIY